MSHYVHLHVAFACNENERTARLAAHHLDLLPQVPPEPRWFLASLAGRTGTNPGPKGGLSLWGMVGQNTSGEDFAAILRPFFLSLLRDSQDSPHDHEHILVFFEPEQSEQAQALEILLDDAGTGIVVRHHAKLPFAWMQF